uniref:Uncharacterized protein n=1 Tax=Octopus bimaculoides TaxID=37653 RepID=A0A0L8FME3_OCTBM
MNDLTKAIKMISPCCAFQNEFSQSTSTLTTHPFCKDKETGINVLTEFPDRHPGISLLMCRGSIR